MEKEVIRAVEAEILKAVKSANETRKGFISPFLLIEYNKGTKEAKLCASFKPILNEPAPEIQYYVVHLDPTNGYPSAVVKNLLGAIALGIKEGKRNLAFVSIRDKIPKGCEKVELKDSLYYETAVEKMEKLEYDTWMTEKEGKMREWNIDLKQVMDRNLYDWAKTMLDLRNLQLI